MTNSKSNLIRFLKKIKITRCYLIIALISCLFKIETTAQGYTEIDSLLKQLEIVKDDSSKIYLLLNIGEYYQNFSQDTALEYFQKGLLLSEKIKSKSQISYSLINIGFINIDRSFFNEAIQVFKQAEKIFEELGNDEGLAKALNALGYAYWKIGDFKGALKCQLEALNLSDKIDDKHSVGEICNDIGLIYWDQKLHQKALEFYNRSLEIKLELKYDKGLSQTYNNIGLIYRELGEKEKALEYYLKSLEYAQGINFKMMMTIAQCNIGRIYTELGYYKKSEVHYHKGLNFARETKNLEGDAVIQIYMAISYIVQKKYEKSIEYGLSGLALTKKISALPFQKLAYEQLAIAYDSLGNYKDAYHYYELFKTFNDGIFNESNAKQIVEMQTKYDTEKKEKENELLRKDNELQQLEINKETNFRNYLILITVLVLILSALLYNKVRSKKRNELALENKVKQRTMELEKAKNNAEENDRLKTAFLANISHEIRTPMNGIMGFAELLKKPQLETSKQKQFLDKIEKCGERLLTIINNLVDVSQLESKQMEVSISEVNINDEIHNLKDSFLEQAQKKGLELICSTPSNNETLILNTDRNKIHSVFTNLIDNAIKFTLSGSIDFGYKKNGEFIEFFVRDTGIGIDDNSKNIIFERFIQADNTEEKQFEGAGLGLSITKAFVEILGGEIWVKSEFWKGSTFYFTIPLKIHDPIIN